MRQGSADLAAPDLARLEAAGARIREVFAKAGYEAVDPAILQPANVFLDRYGEDIRRRIFVFDDPGGAELCLRPDLTIPTCRLYLAAYAPAAPCRLSYQGPAFRFEASASGRPSEFREAGIECFALADREAADAEVMGLALGALRAAGISEVAAEIGDVALFGALVDTLDMPPQWRTRMKRQFWKPDRFAALTARLADAGNEGERGAPGGTARGPAFLTALGVLSEDDARAVVADVLALADIAPVGGRSVEEIAERFLEQAADASAASLSLEAAALIDRFLKIRGRPDKALDEIAALLGKGGEVARALTRARRRLDLLVKAGLALDRTQFSTSFGRGLEYYTGFVFEVRGAGGAALAGGGRYDNLLTELGAREAVPAVGCTVRMERLLAALGEGGAP